MRRRSISKFLFAILVTLMALEVAGLDDNLAMESSVDKVKDERRMMEGFDWSFITGQKRDMEVGAEHRMDNFNWNFNSESSAEEDEEDAERRMDDIDWGFNAPVSDEEEEEEADKRLDDGIDWSFLTEQINEEEDEAEHRMDEFDWSWNTPGESSAEEDDAELDERLEDVRELLDDRDGHGHSHEHLPSKWHQKLKRTKFAYGPPKVQKPPKGQYGPPKTPKRPKPHYGAPKGTKRPKYGAPKAPKRTKTKYGAPKKTHKPSKGQYGPPKTAYHAPAAQVQPQQEPSYNQQQQQQHQAPVVNPPQSAYKETEPVTYQPQQATNPLPPAYRQPELVSTSDFSTPPASTNYPTTPDYSPASVNIASVSPPPPQPSPVAAYGPVVPTQYYYSTPDVASYESRTHSPAPTRSEINFAPYFRPTEPPRQRLGQSSFESVSSDKNDNPGFFQYANFPNFDDIFKQIFKF